MTIHGAVRRLSGVNAGIVDRIVGTSPIELGVDADLRARLAEWAAGRPLVIDWFATRRCNVTVGDLTVRFPSAPLEPRYIELLPIGPVRVVAERSLLPLLAEGASLHRAGPPFLHHIGVGLAHPEDWIDFLDCHPSRQESARPPAIAAVTNR